MANVNELGFDEELIITLEFEDGETEECLGLLVFPFEEKQYIVMIPVSQADDDDADLYLYRYEEDDNGEAIISEIEDDDEYERAIAAFDAFCEDDDEE